MEVVMKKNQELEHGIIPAGTRIKLYEGSVTLLEDVFVDVDQKWVNKAIKNQDDFFHQEKRYMDASSENQKDELKPRTQNITNI